MEEKKKKIQVKLNFDRKYAEKTLPYLKEALSATTYAAIFRTAINLLLTVVRIYKSGNGLLEIDDDGEAIGVIHIIGLEL